MNDNDQTQPVDEFLKRTLYGWDCPPSDQVGDYVVSLLVDEKNTTVAAHVKTCPRCTKELKALQAFLDMPLPDTIPNPAVPQKSELTLVKSPRRSEKIIELFPDMQKASGSDVRGLFDDGMAMYEIDGLALFLQTSRDAEQLVVEGRVVPYSQTDSWENALVTVRQDEQAVAAVWVDDHLAFRCELTGTSPFALRIASTFGVTLVLNGLQ